MRIHHFHRLYQTRLSQATKPFNARGSKIVRCQHCQVMREHCICALQPDIDTQFAVMLLVADKEILKPSNTGRLIVDTVKHSFVYPWYRTEPNAEMLALLSDARYQPVVVFPQEYVDDKTRLVHLQRYDFAGKIPLLIYIDGSWREAKRIFRHSDYLHALPVVSIEPQALSRYVMRKASKDNHLSTAEVASMVMAQLGDDFAAQTLSLWFEVFKSSYLLSKTRVKTDIELREQCIDAYQQHVTHALIARNNLG